MKRSGVESEGRNRQWRTLGIGADGAGIAVSELPG